MIHEPRILKILFAITCCFVLALVPMTAGAQGVIEGTKQGIEKGAKEVGKGVEYGVDKTKEGAEAVGKGVKKTFDKDSDTNADVDRQKPSQNETGTMPSSTTSRSKKAAGSTETGTGKLPKTAGELPILAITGIFALAGAASRMTRRYRNR
jgi:hypothetical protein